MNDRLLEGKNIIVTGTAKGMGKQMLSVFAENGANIWALARKKTDEHVELCSKIAASNRVKIMPSYFDLRDIDSMKSFIKGVRESGLKIDGLVNNAGVTYNALFQMTNIAELRNQFETNFFSPFVFTQYVSKMMVRNKKGSIVNISSSAALDGNSGKSAYGASKAALITMSMCISEELASLGIRSNTICPGVIDTDMLSTIPENVLDKQKASTFLKKIGQSLDIANTALFLLSDYSSYVTGQVIRVDGGVTTYYKR